MSDLTDSVNRSQVQRALISRQLADEYGLDIQKINNHYWGYLEKSNPEISCFNLADQKWQDFQAEILGFKTDIDQLYLWDEEESLRHLLHNIFCLR